MGRDSARPSISKNYFPVALMRLAFAESVPSDTLTVMPGFSSAAVALRPLTLISVNCVIMNVLVTFSSFTVMLSAVTAEIVGG